MRLLAVAIILLVIDLALFAWFDDVNPGAAQALTHPSRSLVAATGNFLIDSINEKPNLATVAPDTNPPICAAVDDRYVPALTKAFSLMRGTDEGERLYQQLVDRGVCVSVSQLDFNGGYSTSWRLRNGNWIRGAIVIDDDYVVTWEADVLAAMLVHESTHVDRSIHGTSCEVTTDCHKLPNGVYLEEEVAAHTAEAQWWEAAYGKNGKSLTFGHDYGENALLSAYLKGPGSFNAYVRDLRSDPREGEGL
ncbi:MAG: hypothetical protein ACJ789_04040 [Thermomicrobiales bacterium]